MSARSGKQTLPELRPLERRPGRARVTGVVEEVVTGPQKCGGAITCFPAPIFGGCTICTVQEDDVIGPRPALARLYENWETDVFCTAERGRSCEGGPLDEQVEEVEGDDDETATDQEDGRAGPRSRATGSVQPVQRLEVRFHARPDESKDRANGLHQILEAVMWSSGDLFVRRGWDLTHKSGDRYIINGRAVKLSLLRPGARLPQFTHLQKVLDYEMAELCARVMVLDGPLRQPLMDYLMQTGLNESYDQRGTENIAGVTGGGKLIDFNITPTDDRILEMRSATIQADLRRSAGGEFERVSALQSEGVKLLGGRQPSAPGSLKLEGAGPQSRRWEASAAPAGA